MALRVKQTKQKKHRWFQYTMEGELIRIWETVDEILEANPGYKWQNIYAAANGNKHTYMQFQWRKHPK